MTRAVRKKTTIRKKINGGKIIAAFTLSPPAHRTGS
jgi:hypothetical protein